MPQGLTEKEAAMLAAIQGYVPLALPENFSLRHGGDELVIHRAEGRCEVTLLTERLLPRALSLLATPGLGAGAPYTEQPVYRELCFMADCSRGAVPNLPAFKKLLALLACMGYTQVQVYMEDVYELESYPYFGYLRGRYTEAELKELDAFAAVVGIELIPAIQTLAHLERALRWKAMQGLRDFHGILLADEEATYALIGQMFAAMARCFSSRRINVGMDEAHMLGLGRYLDKHGPTDRTALMLRHINRVAAIAREHGFAPMMWSDMFFRLASGGDYYGAGIAVDPAVAAEIPEGMSLIYWDYYARDEAVYDRMLTAHQALCPSVIFAGGAWKWNGHCPCNAHSMAAAKAAHQSCRRHKVDEVIVTAWGDNGAECSMFAVLPTLQLWAELCHAGRDDEAWLAGRLRTCTGASWQALTALDRPVFVPGNPAPGAVDVNPPKNILYQDILSGLFDAHIDADAFEAHFAECAEQLAALTESAGEGWGYLLETIACLCEILAVKCRAGIDLRRAYQGGDKATLTRYRDDTLPGLLARLDRFTALYHRQWLAENKAAGLDISDLKIGGLCQRVRTAITRLDDWLTGEAERIEELEETLLPYDGRPADSPAAFNLPAAYWHMSATPGLIENI